MKSYVTILQSLKRIKFAKLLCFQLSQETKNGSRMYFGHVNSFGAET